MADLLLIAASAAECESLAAFGQAYGAGYDILCLSGSAPTDLGAERVLNANSEVPTADALASALAPIAKEYKVVAASASMTGKDWAPRLAGLVDRPMASDIIAVLGPGRFSRPMYAGNVIADVEIGASEFVLTVRSTAFASPKRSGGSVSEDVSLSYSGSTDRTGVAASDGGRPDLCQARVVVSGGRPLKDAETFEKLIGGLADVLGGAVGATRAAVDNGIAPNELQVGQTGKVVAPELYIAAGISGSTQHMAGMKDSKVIVVINTDPEAPLFEIADYGLVQDLFIAVPELIEKLRA
ncbi:MAG: electron transfer flavoprotein subunit alpha/FixB family protein [Armatimonadetes bacterium]|nr:electron transfer flavoprotein subunit alpha/FixB family protein [Armatimonadota bacterium]